MRRQQMPKPRPLIASIRRGLEPIVQVRTYLFTPVTSTVYVFAGSEGIFAMICEAMTKVFTQMQQWRRVMSL